MDLIELYLIEQSFNDLQDYVDGLRNQISRLTVKLVESHKWNEALSDDLLEWDNRLQRMEELAHTMYDALVDADRLLEFGNMATSSKMIDAMEEYWTAIGYNR